MSKGRIYIVEDESVTAMDIAFSLQCLEYEVVGQSVRAETAIQKIEEIKPDLVLMDIHLKGEMDGIQAAEYIHTRLDIPVVFLSAHADPATLKRAQISEPYGYILKPYEERELDSNVSIALYKHGIEKKLRQSEFKHRTLFENMAQGVLYQDANGTITSCNPAAERILGLNLEQMQGKLPLDPRWKLVQENGADFPLDLQPINIALRTRREVNNVMGIFDPKREGYVWIRVHVIPQFIGNEPLPYQVFTTFEDITDLRQAEMILQASEARYRSLVETSPDAIILTDIEQKLLSANPKAISLHGYKTFDEMLSHCGKAANLISPEDRTRAREDAGRALMDGHVHNLEYTGLRRDGSSFPIEVSISVVQDDNGHPIAFISISRDITKRKRSEIELRRLSEAVRQSANAIVLTDTEGNIEFVNPKFTETSGYLLSEVIGKNPRFLKSDEHSPEFYRSLWHTIKSGGIWRGEFHNRRKDGTLYWEAGTIAPVYDATGRLINFIAVKEDITHRKMLEETERDQRKLAEALRDTAMVLNSTLKLDDVLDRILTNIGKLVNYDAAMALTLDGDAVRKIRYINNSQSKLQPSALGDLQANLINVPILKTIVRTRQAYLIPDIQLDPRWQSVSIPGMERSRALICVPIIIQNQVAGVLNVISSTPDFFNSRDMDRIATFASQAAIAVANAQLYEHAKRLSIVDPLTELFNMRYFLDFGLLEFERVRRYARELSIIMIDIDHFKNINDTHGHDMGDFALREITKRIKHIVRASDVVARYGGEEFVVLMPETGITEAAHVAERLRQVIGVDPIMRNNLCIEVTASLGVADLGPSIHDFEMLLKNADKALYTAKNSGRDRVSVWQINEQTPSGVS